MYSQNTLGSSHSGCEQIFEHCSRQISRTSKTKKEKTPLSKNLKKPIDPNDTQSPPLMPPDCCLSSRQIIISVGCNPTAVLITKAISPLPLIWGCSTVFSAPATLAVWRTLNCVWNYKLQNKATDWKEISKKKRRYQILVGGRATGKRCFIHQGNKIWEGIDIRD